MNSRRFDRPKCGVSQFSVGIVKDRSAASRGRPDVYHETMTWAYMLVINERVARSGKEMGWAEFSQTHADLFDHSNTVLHRYYRRETLESPLARKTFLMPERRD